MSFQCPECGHDQSDFSVVLRVDLIARPAKTPKLYAEVSHEADMDLEAIVSSAVAELGYDSVKPEQKAALLAFLRGRDVFVSLPTWYGKSLCYAALPAAFDSLRRSPSQSIVVVVSPLIALMKDQVATLSGRGLSVGCVTSESPTMWQTWSKPLAKSHVGVYYFASAMYSLRPRGILVKDVIASGR